MELSNEHISEFATVDYLLMEEMYALRRSHGFYWYGKSDITDLEAKHSNERMRLNTLLKIKYNSEKDLSDKLYEYIILEHVDRYSNFKKMYNNYNSLSEDDKLFCNIINKFNEYYQKFQKEFENINSWVPDLYVVVNELQKYRILGRNISSPIKYITHENIENCTICMDSTNQIDCITNCKHQFHKSCITYWIEVNNICPLCRQDMPEVIDVNISNITLV
jgi:hypothetical protein